MGEVYLARDEKRSARVAQAPCGERGRRPRTSAALSPSGACRLLTRSSAHSHHPRFRRAQRSTVRDALTRSYQSILPLTLEGQTGACVRLLDELAPRNPDPGSVTHIARTYARLGAPSMPPLRSSIAPSTWSSSVIRRSPAIGGSIRFARTEHWRGARSSRASPRGSLAQVPRRWRRSITRFAVGSRYFVPVFLLGSSLGFR